MSINTVRTASWLQTFAQIMEVDRRQINRLHDKKKHKAEPVRQPLIVKRRLSHD
jgi:hypothetical protein